MGQFWYFGTVSVCPDFWNRGVAKQLVEQSLALLDQWGVRQAGLFTFAESAKHIALYQKFGFWPQHLTAVMSMRPVVRGSVSTWSRYSTLSSREQEDCLTKCALVTETNFPGLDVTLDLRAIADQRLGEIVLIHDDLGLGGFACCHLGAGSEAGTDSAFVKFAAVRAGQNASELFGRLVVGCTELAASSGCQLIVAGVNTARHQAYRTLIDQGFHTFFHGVAMLRPNNPAFNRADCFVMDDLR
jgi:hypothetical protein